MNNMMEPKIRFKGFEGEWKTPSIGEVFELRNGYTPSKAVNEFWEGGTIPWFRMEDIRTNGGFLKDAIQHITPLAVKGAGLFEKNSIILATTATIGVHAMLIADSLANQQFTNFRVRKSLSNSYIGNFLYYSFFNIDEWSKKNTNSGGLLSVNMPLLVKQPLYSPCKQEQKAIASYFTSLDSKISAATSRLASLKQMKAANLQAMFPQEGETVPKIRFKGFEGEWKKVKLSEILTERHENSTITDGLPQLSFTIADGVIRPEDRKSNKRDFLIKDIDNKRYLVTKVGDIIYNPANVVYGAIHRNSLMNGVVSPIYKIFTTMQDSNFIECAVRRPSFITKLAMCTEGTVTKLKTLKPEAFLNMVVCITPSLEEQKLIGNYFTSLDRQISLQSQRLEKLKQIKSACLDKMFV